MMVLASCDNSDNSDNTAAGSGPRHEAPRGGSGGTDGERAAATAASAPKTTAPKHEAVKAALPVDGDIGPATVGAMQTSLDAGTS